MIKNLLQDKEPVAYQCLFNDLKNDSISHSYLFVGKYSSLKIDAAFLLAQSIIEGKRDFACEECSTCQRIKNQTYVDFKYIDGYKGTIKKEDIEEIMSSFSLTALEKANKKVYIISNINNSSTKVLNMILKFVEEPINNTYAIFISDDESSLLSTITSRCQKIRFKTIDFSYLIEKYREKGFSNDDAYLLSCINHSINNEILFNNEPFIKAKNTAYELIDNLGNKEYIPILLSNNYVSSLSKKEYFRESFDCFIAIMLQMLEDSISMNSIIDDNYNIKIGRLSKGNPEKLLKIFVEARNTSKVPVNRQLLLDKIACEIIK